MTLVAAIFFVGLRRLLARARRSLCASRSRNGRPAAAIVGASSTTCDRLARRHRTRPDHDRHSSCSRDDRAAVRSRMRNLAFAASLVILIDPAKLPGASFPLLLRRRRGAWSAVYEAATDLASAGAMGEAATPSPRRAWTLGSLAPIRNLRHGPAALACRDLLRTKATASFMAYNFHELSPYVLIGNPLDSDDHRDLRRAGRAARHVALSARARCLRLALCRRRHRHRHVGGAADRRWPGSTMHLHAFAPWAIVFLALAVLSAVIWRSRSFRATPSH